MWCLAGWPHEDCPADRGGRVKLTACRDATPAAQFTARGPGQGRKSAGIARQTTTFALMRGISNLVERGSNGEVNRQVRCSV
jgi:hypothetical protein